VHSGAALSAALQQSRITRGRIRFCGLTETSFIR
jgi:hypothetical protein